MFGCNAKPPPEYVKEQARLQRKWEAEKAITPGAAPYVPNGRGRPGPKANTESAETKKLKELEARTKKQEQELQKLRKASGGTGSAPNATAQKAAPTKAVEDCEERLRYAQDLAQQ